MTTITNLPLLCHRRNPETLFADRLHTISSTCNKLLNGPLPSSATRTLAVKCGVGGGGFSEEGEVMGSGLRQALSGLVGEQVEELLKREANKELLDGLEKATLRVEMAKRELAEIERQEIEARKLRDYINQLESRTSEIAECQRELLEARTMVEEAERSLSAGGAGRGDDLMEVEIEEIDRNEERKESVKAAFISALVGSLAGLPISLAQVNSTSHIILPLGVTFVSCALFGVTFRYAIRRDLDNLQLKMGTSAAFGFVKGLAMLESGPPLELEAWSLMSRALNGAVFVSENLLVFLFAAVGLDFCYKLRLLSPFPIKKPASETNNL